MNWTQGGGGTARAASVAAGGGVGGGEPHPCAAPPHGPAPPVARPSVRARTPMDTAWASWPSSPRPSIARTCCPRGCAGCAGWLRAASRCCVRADEGWAAERGDSGVIDDHQRRRERPREGGGAAGCTRGGCKWWERGREETQDGGAAPAHARSGGQAGGRARRLAPARRQLGARSPRAPLVGTCANCVFAPPPHTLPAAPAPVPPLRRRTCAPAQSEVALAEIVQSQSPCTALPSPTRTRTRPRKLPCRPPWPLRV